MTRLSISRLGRALSVASTSLAILGAAQAQAALIVPAYNSLPSAGASLFLDFDGVVYSGNWSSGTPGTVPAYDTNNAPGDFSQGELDNIREIFLRVAEKYSPFNINVTTVDPGVYNNRETARVVIGGDGRWYRPDGPPGGVAFVGSFYNSSVNTGWVFPKNLSGGLPKTVAEAAAHEAGHMFGLNHQSAYNAQGERTQDYSTNGNSPYTRPVMGSSYGSQRGLWWNGTTSSATTIQDDLAVLANSNNAFGYRADDHGSTIETAEFLTADAAGRVSATGIIERMTDADMFSFATDTGTVSFSLAVAEFGAMLDATLRLFTAEGALLRTVNSATLGESFTNALTAGQYMLGVYSHGDYGDLGQYTLTGQVVIPEPATLLAGTMATLLLGRRRRV